MKNEATDLLARLQRYNKQQILDRLKQSDPILFEHLVALLFEHRGFQAEVVGKSGDEGVDVRLQSGKSSAVVQCKRYADSVGQPTIRDLYGTMLHNNANEAYLVTTAQITRQAKEWAFGKPINFIDGFALTEWIVEAGQESSFGWFGLGRLFGRFKKSPANNTRSTLEMSSQGANNNQDKQPSGGLRFWFWPMVVLAILLFGIAIGIAYNRLAPRWNLESPIVETTPITIEDSDQSAGTPTDSGNATPEPDQEDNAASVEATNTPTSEAEPTPESTATVAPTTEEPTATETAPPPTNVPTLAPTPTWTPEGESAEVATGCSIPVDGEFQQFYRASLGCPTDSTGLHWAAWEPFERGYLLWRSDTDAAYALYGPSGGTWFQIAERWDGSLPAPRGEPPSTNLVAPERGFGYVWGIRDDIFENLGWATDIEKGFCALIQPFDSGFILQSIPVDSCTAERLFNNAMAAEWRPITVIASADQQFTIQ